jgi:hypothetical protein
VVFSAIAVIADACVQEKIVETKYPPPLSTVINNINCRTPVIAESTDDRGEWILLKSSFLPDQILFERLQRSWRDIVLPKDRASFALVHCRFGHKPGVWLHHLSTPTLCAEYLAGCYAVESWV